jgi:hypothetical protein
LLPIFAPVVGELDNHPSRVEVLAEVKADLVIAT